MPRTHFDDPLTEESQGNSRKWGDARDAVKFAVVETIVGTAREYGLSNGWRRELIRQA
jgi:hypothetical protein